MTQEQKIGKIGNHYGGLLIYRDDNKFYWGIKDWDETYWEEIPGKLFNDLKEFEEARENDD